MDDKDLILAVAQKVMGWSMEGRNFPTTVFHYTLASGEEYAETLEWNPITNANHWMEVVEAMKVHGWSWSMHTYSGDVEGPLHRIYAFKGGVIVAKEGDNFGRLILQAAYRAMTAPPQMMGFRGVIDDLQAVGTPQKENS